MKLLLLLFLLNNSKPALDTPVTKPNYFIAMQYKAGISNCIYKVFVTDDMIMCAKVNGYITVSPSFGLGTVIPKDKRQDSEAYVNKKLDAKYHTLPSTIEAFLAINNANFVIKKADIKKIYHDPSPKWGMGPYPHNGKINIVSRQRIDYDDMTVTNEFILVGDQSSEEVLAKLKGLNP